MDEATKEALVAEFRAYLDAVAGGDRAGGGVGVDSDSDTDSEVDSDSDFDFDFDFDFDSDSDSDGEDAPDLFSLLAELAALKNEVKLESRQVKGALDEFRGLFDTLRETGSRLADEQERRCEQTRAADREGWKAMLLSLLELRDRLQAGHDQAAGFRPGWLARRGRAAALVASLAEGMAMNLRRLDETLARRGLRRLAAVGNPFDPQTMHAAELARDPGRPNGQVVTELRPGWLLHDRLLRAAEVVVNRTDTPQHPESPT